MASCGRTPHYPSFKSGCPVECGNALSATTTLHLTRSFQLLDKHRNHLVPAVALEPPGGDAYRVWLIPAVSEG